jgi:hypothetical protein
MKLLAPALTALALVPATDHAQAPNPATRPMFQRLEDIDGARSKARVEAGLPATSGYAYIVKIVPRADEPREMFRGQKTDVGSEASVLRREGDLAQKLMD